MTHIGKKTAVKYGLVFFLGLLFISIVIMLVVILLFADLLAMISMTGLLMFFIFFCLMLLVPFYLALRLFGNKVEKDLIQNKKLIKVSANFSFGVNFFIWTALLIPSMLILGFESITFLIISYILLIAVLGSITTFSFGLFIAKDVKRQLEMTNNHVYTSSIKAE